MEQSPAPADQVKEAVLSHRAELVRHGRTEIYLHLDPPELGRVRLHLSGDGDTVSARLVAQEKGTVALLENQAAGMRQRLEEVGITLAKFEVAWQGTGQSDRWQEQPAPQPWSLAPGQRGLPAPRRGGATMPARGRIDFLA